MTILETIRVVCIVVGVSFGLYATMTAAAVALVVEVGGGKRLGSQQASYIICQAVIALFWLVLAAVLS